MDDAAPPGALPDLLRDGLEVVFVGINPSRFSAAQGHYFARGSNRFWPAFSRSRLSEPARLALGVERLVPAHDGALLAHGFGFTDVVKHATANASELAFADLAAGAAALVAKLGRFAPRVACFHGVTAWRPVQRALAGSASQAELGPQSLQIGRTQLFVVPNPSPANAHFTPDDQMRWYDRLAAFLAEAC